MRARVMLIGAVVAIAAPAHAGIVRGTVFVDADGDGKRGVEEVAVPDAVVGWRDRRFVQADLDGAYQLDIDDNEAGEVWVRVPDGFRPGPVWRAARAAPGITSVDLPVVRLTKAELAQPLRFVVASDAHMQGTDVLWTAHDLGLALAQATALDPPPRFLTILGDLTQDNRDPQFQQLDAARADLGPAWVPVPGNHDWYDGGAGYRKHYGPSSYSFDTGGAHVVVWNASLSQDALLAFLTADLARVDPEMPVIALGHVPPNQVVIDAMRALGVDYLLCGHWHSNRIVDHGGLIEYDTAPLIMGGLDGSPAGYRVFTLAAGKLTSEFHAIVDAPTVALVSPRAGCADPEGFDLIASAAIDAADPIVTATIDGAAPVALTSVGGWDYQATVALAPGRHTIALHAQGATAAASTTAAIDVCAPPTLSTTGGTWAGLGGGPTHTNARGEGLATPLVTAWTTAVGGHLLAATPAIADGLVFVAVTDLGQGTRGGVVALDLGTGAERWRWTSASATRAGPAVGHGLVVASTEDGTITALDAATGEVRWVHPLGLGLDDAITTLWASPTIADDVVYIGVQHRMAALDLLTGDVRWQLEAVPDGDGVAVAVAATVANGLVLDQFHRDKGGIIGWRAIDGHPEWRRDGDEVVAVNASPIIAEDRVFVANGRDEVTAFDQRTGDKQWSTKLDDQGFDWGYAIVGTPAYADGRLFVPTRYRDLVALDASTGAVRWRFAGGSTPLHVTHYRGHSDGFAASPVVTGDTVWIAGVDGKLTALDAATGAVRWEAALGVPVLGGLAVAGDRLIVTSFDGTVRALAPVVEPAAGGCNAGGGSSLGLVVIALVLRRRRRAQGL
ncbi:MAG: PQQ-binding-like beta-propeller repeat protein [Deltaproteobacteria bacterium]|nr:PQQ-binding-like beta-propeller repeat protein [Deltaproteobacteria bacterium]